MIFWHRWTAATHWPLLGVMRPDIIHRQHDAGIGLATPSCAMIGNPARGGPAPTLIQDHPDGQATSAWVACQVETRYGHARVQNFTVSSSPAASVRLWKLGEAWIQLSSAYRGWPRHRVSATNEQRGVQQTLCHRNECAPTAFRLALQLVRRGHTHTGLFSKFP